MKALLFFAFVAPLIVQIARCQELPIPNRYEGMKIGTLDKLAQWPQNILEFLLVLSKQDNKDNKNK